MVLSQAKEALEGLRQGMIEIAAECMLQEKEQIVGLLVSQQFEEGIDATGKPLRQYSRSYIEEKTKAGVYRGMTDLNLTGEFQAVMNLRVDPSSDEFEFDSPAMTADGVLKSEWLNKWNADRGGATVMDLTPENRDKIFPIIQDAFIEKCNERLALD